MSTTKDLGFLSLGDFRLESGSMTPNGKTQTDIYKFTTGSVVATVSFGSFPSSPSQSPLLLHCSKTVTKAGF